MNLENASSRINGLADYVANRNLSSKQFRATKPSQVAAGTWREVYADTGELVHKNPSIAGGGATKPVFSNGRWREASA